MFGRRMVLGRILGFEIRADISWVFLALLILWSLASGFFPSFYEGLPQGLYWTLALVGTIGLFASLLFHELSHSVVARAYGLEIQGITLFLFGGAAEMREEPRTAVSEFLMAIAGPIASLVLAAGFYVLALLVAGVGTPEHWVGVPRYLAIVNLALAVFNLLPAFPMDGGRALRAALWYWGKDLRSATKVASRLGQGLGMLLMAAGIAQAILLGNFVGGMWWFLIGLFVQGNAGATYQQLLNRFALHGMSVREVMTEDPVVADPDMTLRRLVDEVVYPQHHHRFPVVREGRLLGYVGTNQIKQVDADVWERTRVGDVMVAAGDDNVIAPDAGAEKALERLQQSETGWLMVADGERLHGVLALRDLLQYLQLRQELEAPA
ncbi:site-2 protease family protein [Ferruginivarius sediminum]|uniref:Zinc metalloprotease n=1 Tax=Ferruginivarius sediminum TaxID=2661937 RepID=A0A369TCF2_9PROT|nr:site-2 protease family protein [Ferruginivarius sediminum]RDD62960.1 site-2 protease family protein [Ferruginivarius sediminum]